MFEGVTNNMPYDDSPKPAVNGDKIKIPLQLQLDKSAEEAIREAQEEADRKVKSARRETKIAVAFLIPALLISAGVSIVASTFWTQRNEKAVTENNKLRNKLAKSKAELAHLKPTIDNCSNANYKKGVQIEDMSIFIDELNKCGRAHDVYRKGLCFEGAMQKEHKRQKKNRRNN